MRSARPSEAIPWTSATSEIRLSDLDKELRKVELLAWRGLANHYLLLTNCVVTGEIEAAARERFLALPGIQSFSLYGRDWINLRIAESPRLRAFVPRLYGLGDLSQILDERAYIQTQEILTSIGPDLKKLVVTKAQRDSAKALFDCGFVLLLGDPATGKSTIGASLSIAAMDSWQAQTLKLDSPKDLSSRWNPNDPIQFFWVDDAFGTTQYRKDLADEWNRAFPIVSAALQKGARFLFTSRTYIYEAAADDLKLDAMPALRRSKVVIRVQDLNLAEKAQILYNHIKLGTQPPAFKRRIRPFLSMVANSTQFLPETARRLGNPLFTESLNIYADSVKQFVDKPVDYLLDVVRSLDVGSRAALALIFMRGGKLVNPPSFSQEEVEAIARLGTVPAQALAALRPLIDSLVKLVTGPTDQYWTFQHPTVRDAFASYVGARPELVDLYLLGAPIDQLIAEVVCGDYEVAGAKVRVPSALFGSFTHRLSALALGNQATFLASRCSNSFLEYFAARNSELVFDIFSCKNIGVGAKEFLARRLRPIGLLTEASREAVAHDIMDAISSWQFDLLESDRYGSILNERERAEAIDQVKGFIADIDFHIDDLADTWTKTDDPQDHFEDFSDAVRSAERLLGDSLDAQTAANGLETIRYKIERLYERYEPEPDPEPDDDLRGASLGAADDAIFSDVAD